MLKKAKVKRPRPRRQEGYGTLSCHVPGLDLPVYVVVDEVDFSIGLIAEHTTHCKPRRSELTSQTSTLHSYARLFQSAK